MAGEMRLQFSLSIRKQDGNIILLDARHTASFQATVTGTKGPVPGAITVPVLGVAVNFGELTTPSICTIKNMDAVNWVEYGIRDPGIDVFYPLGEVWAGEEWPIRFSRNLQEEYTGTGSGTTPPDNYFWIKAHGGPVVVQINAYEW